MSVDMITLWIGGVRRMKEVVFEARYSLGMSFTAGYQSFSISRHNIISPTRTVASSRHTLSKAIRSMILGCLPRRSLSTFIRPRPFSRRCRRKFSTSSATAPTVQSSLSMLASLTTELDKIAPRIDINASQLKILKRPVDFYDFLLTVSLVHI
jgi:hypothetical protein